MNDTGRLFDVKLMKASLDDSSGINFATYAEPPNNVVTVTGPDSLHGYLVSSPASKLAKSTCIHKATS